MMMVMVVVGMVAPAMQAENFMLVGDASYAIDTLVYPHQVGPGLTAAKYDLPDMPLKISVMDMDVTNPYINMETCLGNDKSPSCERPTKMAERKSYAGHEVVGAINGDFFMTSPASEVGIPVSGQVTNGELMVSPHNRACFILDEQRNPFIDRLNFSGTVTGDSVSFDLKFVNRMRKAYESIADNISVLYTNHYGTTTYTYSEEGTMVLLSPAEGAFSWRANGSERCVVDSIFDAVGAATIPTGKAILWLKGTYAEYAAKIAVGSTLTLGFSTTLASGITPASPLDEVVGGSNHIILLNGELQEDWTERHPRTFIAFNEDSTHIYYVVVDGRQQGSVGCTLSEASGILLAIGAHHAINLDGGGSSVLMVNGDIVNSPT